MRDFKILSRYFGVPTKPRPDPAIKKYAAQKAAATKALSKLLAQYPRIQVEKESHGGYWVQCKGVDPDSEADPCYGGHYAIDSIEALESAQVYVEFLKEKV